MKTPLFLCFAFFSTCLSPELFAQTACQRQFGDPSLARTGSFSSLEKKPNSNGRFYKSWLRRGGEHQNPGRNNTDSDSMFFQLIREIKKHYPKLPKNQQKALIIEFKKTGDLNLRNKIISHNLGLVIKSVMKYKRWLPPFFDSMDLFQVGTERLIKALDKYDPYLGFEFGTFAIPHVEGKMKVFLFENAHIVSIKNSPKNNRLFFNLRRYKADLSFQNQNFDPNIAAQNLSTDKIQISQQNCRADG